MLRRGLVTLVLLLVPTSVWAQAGPDRLLPGGSQIYLRWDGFALHREAFDKSALGMTLQGDTGKFLGGLWSYALETLEALAGQADPKVPAAIKEVTKVLSAIGQNGFAIGLEARSVIPPDGEAVLVFPKSAPTIMPLLQKLTELGKGDIRETKVGKRTVYSAGAMGIHVGWWSEGDDAVFMIGGGEPVAYAKRIDAKETGLAGNATYKKVASFKDFPVWARAYVDVASVIKVAAAVSPEAGQIFDDLGLKGVSSLTFLSGFDGPAERSFVDLHFTGQRKGLLALLNKKTITLADLPPMPEDVSSFSASNFNMKNLYDGGVQIAEAAAKVVAPNQGIDVREAIQQVEGIVGVKFSEELFGSFEGMAVQYSAGSEGLLGFGAVAMLKVKDEKKLLGAINTLFRGIPPLPGVEISLNKKAYRGVDIHNIHLKANEVDVPLMYFAVHKGWFLLASSPQPLFGYVLRTKGDLPTWKANARLLKALEQFPKEFTAISVSDPRPTVQFVLATLPTVVTFANSFAGQLGNIAPGAPQLRPFDVSLIPHPQDAVRHLFPNISVTTDNGQRIRTDTRASLAIPFLN